MTSEGSGPSAEPSAEPGAEPSAEPSAEPARRPAPVVPLWLGAAGGRAADRLGGRRRGGVRLVGLAGPTAVPAPRRRPANHAVSGHHPGHGRRRVRQRVRGVPGHRRPHPDQQPRHLSGRPRRQHRRPAPNGEQLPATLVGRDNDTDLAVIKVERSRPHPIRFGSPPTVGDQVFAIGAPLGLSDTFTAGVVSTLNRSVRVPADGDTTALITSAIQTDAAINPGNSGGTLANCAALVGVPTAGATASDSLGVPVGGSIGLGFAIPAAFAQRIADQLIANGHASHGDFGMSVVPVVRAENGIPRTRCTSRRSSWAARPLAPGCGAATSSPRWTGGRSTALTSCRPSRWTSHPARACRSATSAPARTGRRR